MKQKDLEFINSYLDELDCLANNEIFYYRTRKSVSKVADFFWDCLNDDRPFMKTPLEDIERVASFIKTLGFIDTSSKFERDSNRTLKLLYDILDMGEFS
jgi:hypothetical protein